MYIFLSIYSALNNRDPVILKSLDIYLDWIDFDIHIKYAYYEIHVTYGSIS